MANFLYNIIRNLAYKLTRNNDQIGCNPLVKRFILNKKDKDDSLFPFRKFRLYMWNYDVFKPTINLVGKGFDLYFSPVDGFPFDGFPIGKYHRGSLKNFNYIVKNFPIWLKEKSKLDETVTNREMALKIHEEFQDMLK